MKSEIFYLDDDNNIVSEENATHAIIREYDKSGNLVRENFMVKASERSDDLSDEDIELLKEFEEKYANNLVRLNVSDGKNLNETSNEKYYSVKNDQYFFKIVNERLFYLLNDEFEWVYCPPLRDVYFDAASDYIEVTGEYVERYISAYKDTMK